MTTHSDGVFAYGGVPCVGTGSGVPTTYGEYIFVDPDSSGADNGKTMKNAFRTIDQAVTLAQTNTHAVILMNANSAHSTGSGTEKELTLTKSRIHFVGLGGGSRYLGQRTRWTMGVSTTDDSDAIAVVQNTGVGNTFTNIKFDSGDTNTTSLYTFAEGGEYTQFTNCEFYRGTLLGTANTAELLMNGDSAYLKNCAIGSLATQHTSTTHANVLFARTTIAGKVARDVMFEDCFFWLKSSQTAATHWLVTGATDIERILVGKKCQFIHARLGSASVVDAIKVDAEQTEGYIVLDQSFHVNHTNFSSGTTATVQYYGSERATAGTAGDPIALT